MPIGEIAWLRDRIAAVIENQVDAHPDEVIHLSDAVIAGLGMRTDRVGKLVRWVTDWEFHD